MTEQPDHTPADRPPDDDRFANEMPFGEEPPVQPDDTQPRAPVTVADDDEGTPAFAARLAAEEPPIDPLADTAERLAQLGSPPVAGRAMLLLVVMGASACLCLMMIGFAGVAGYRDGLATNDARVTQTLATGIAQQYALGVSDQENGFAELAAARYAWIVETLRAPTQYAQDSAARLAMVRTMAAYTPTPPPTVEPTQTATLEPTITPTPEPSLEPSATLSPLEDPDYLFSQAQTAMMFTDYEDAIELFQSLRALDPTYRQVEVEGLLQEAMINQARIYLNGGNEDGQDRLQRGVNLMSQAQELGPIEPNLQLLIGQANFVQAYILARDYVNGGFYGQALPILEDLCNQNCEWEYPNVNGVSVRDLLNRAQQGTGASQ